ncbi:metallophosphoesterase family protein [Aliivibrio logei]|uniref:Phosphoesterase n=1 Tax=Aliivibrio logei TaxID=688 RepID=A0A1B9NVF5_ALILO|nr:metallophosphoesterase family protein [Aliivibrio logei]OCH18567.1 hypothetical protein A6E04_01730 [Aliivibrio logei]
MKIAVISDIHSNKPALDAVILDIKNNRCTHIFVLGDLIGYYHWPKYVVEELMTLDNCTVIRGNHEDLLVKARNNKEFNMECYRKYGNGLNVCIENLSTEQMAWLDSLPTSAEVCIDNLKIGLFHGSERETDEYLYPDVSKSRIKEIPDDQFDFIFFGHTHYPVVFNKGCTVIANPGSVGQPRDVGSLASYLILNTRNRAISFKRVPFDSHEVRNKVLEYDPDYHYLTEILKRNNPYA